MKKASWIVAAAALAIAGGCQFVGDLDKFHMAPAAEEGGTGPGGSAGGDGGVGGDGGDAGGGGAGGGVVCAGEVAYVDDDATGASSGASWADAFTSLQDALSYAEACPDAAEIWVAAGSYTPGVAASDTFQLRTGLSILGGFAGGESTVDQRDWSANSTILTGDLQSDDSTTSGVVVDPDDIEGTNSLHVVSAEGVDDTAILDGFTITAGSADGAQDDGGGIMCGAGSPMLRNLLVRGNRATGDGGGLYSSGAPVLEAVSFLDNKASQVGGGVALDGASATMKRVLLSGNDAGTHGGALSFVGGTHELHNCALSGNRAGSQGGGYNAVNVAMLPTSPAGCATAAPGPS